MIIDFHIHAKITNTFPFNKKHFNYIIKKAKREGIDAIAITEHLHAKNFDEAYNYLKDNFNYNGEYYLVDGIKVFAGVEVSTCLKPQPQLDFVFIGHREDIFNLKEFLIPHMSLKRVEIEKLFMAKQIDNMLIILAHPFRNHEEFPELSDDIINKIDAVEYNAEDLTKKSCMIKKIDMFAKKIKKPIVGGSDSHYFIQVGSIKNILDGKTCSIKEIKTHIKENKVKIEISKNLVSKVERAKEEKIFIVENNIKK